MGCKSSCFKLCPVSLGIAVGLTAMLSMWVVTMWGAYVAGESTAAYMQQMMAAMGDTPIWQIYLGVFLKGLFAGFFIALFYDLCRCVGSKMCRKSCEQSSCSCGCSCCGAKK